MDTIRHQSRSHDPHTINDDVIDNIVEVSYKVIINKNIVFVQHLFPEGDNYKNDDSAINMVGTYYSMCVCVLVAPSLYQMSRTCL